MNYITAVEKVTLLHIAQGCEQRGEDSYARVVRQMVQRLWPDVRVADDAAKIGGAFGHIVPQKICPVCLGNSKPGDCSCVCQMS